MFWRVSRAGDRIALLPRARPVGLPIGAVAVERRCRAGLPNIPRSGPARRLVTGLAALRRAKVLRMGSAAAADTLRRRLTFCGLI